MYLDDAVTAITGFEGRVNWMYLDTKGNVTVGVGQLLSSADEAVWLPFHRHTAEFADSLEIVGQFDAVKKMQPGLKPLAYRRFESLLLADDDIDSMLRNTLTTCAFELSALFPGFYEYPDSAKVGLLDMRFNLGVTRLREMFPAFCKSVAARKWDAAALQCHRLEPSKERNAWTKEQFATAGSLQSEENIA